MLNPPRSTRLATSLLAAVAAVTLALGSSQALSQARVHAGMSPERVAVLDQAIQAEVERGRVAGMVVAVVRHGRIVHNKAYGYANRESGERMTTDHLFRLYSMTKPVASVALLTLYEQGHFQLTDPLDRYIPGFSDLQVFAGHDDNDDMILTPPARKPTIQDAFRHTLGLASGLGRHPVDAIYREKGLAMGALESLSDEIEKLGQVPLVYDPGERWLYGLGHDVQAYLVEEFSGMPYGEYLRQTIFEPLGMRDTMFGVPPEHAGRFARVYEPDGEGGLRPEAVDGYARYTDHHFGTLSLSSSADDYLTFARMLLNGGELNGVRILGRKTVELLSRNHLPENIPSINNGTGPAATGYGLGFSVTLDPAALGRLDSVGSFGWSGAATTVFRVDPAEDMAYVIMAQTYWSDGPLLDKVQTLIYQALGD
jgi:CubicO group peptidase (beta-lactamase class C family)